MKMCSRAVMSEWTNLHDEARANIITARETKVSTSRRLPRDRDSGDRWSRAHPFTADSLIGASAPFHRLLRVTHSLNLEMPSSILFTFLPAIHQAWNVAVR